MYAIARLIYETEDQVFPTIELYRDPIGEKHVYYLNTQGFIAISSVPGLLGMIAKEKGFAEVNKDLC